MNGYFTARQLHNGQVIVLAPDGLTWETEPGQLPTLESNQSFALRLNEWLSQKPDPSQVEPFFNPVLPGETVGVEELLSIIDKLYAAEDRFDALSVGLSRYAKGSKHQPAGGISGTDRAAAGSSRPA